jgi:hypothetical protein
MRLTPLLGDTPQSSLVFNINPVVVGVNQNCEMAQQARTSSGKGKAPLPVEFRGGITTNGEIAPLAGIMKRGAKMNLAPG